jgi:putative selenium metabolism hydrolase
MDTLDKELVGLAQALIRIPSLTGAEAEIAEFVRDYLAAAGLETWVDEYHSVIGVLRRGAGPTVLYDSHIDTVEVNPAEWKHAPFGGEIEEGRLYGRGAADMKGALAAILNAAKRLAQDAAFHGTLIVTGTSLEERVEGLTLGRALDKLAARGLRPDAVVIGEASELNLKRGQRGRTRVHVDIQGRAAHSAHPEKGINAVYQAMSLVQAIRALPMRRDELLGPEIAEVIAIESLPRPMDSIVPYACRVSYDLRLLPGDTRESVLERFAGVARQLQKADPAFCAAFQIAPAAVRARDGREEIVEPFPPAWKFPEDHPLVQRALAALRGIGQDPALTKYGFCTNGSYSAGVAGIPTLGYGPGAENGAHVVDEYVEISELEKAAAGYVAIAVAIAKGLNEK